MPEAHARETPSAAIGATAVYAQTRICLRIVRRRRGSTKMRKVQSHNLGKNIFHDSILGMQSVYVTDDFLALRLGRFGLNNLTAYKR